MLLGLELVVLIVFAAVSFRLVKSISRDSPIRKEFGVSNSLPFAVALFPVGAALVPIAPAIEGSLLYVAAAALYAPAFVLARRQERVLEVAGTDRVNGARQTIAQVFAGALCGLIYVAVVGVIS
jgi:hypothetical protein